MRSLSRFVLLWPILLILLTVSPAFSGYELPPGERITNLPHIPRAMPQKEAYEVYDPVIGRNFDLKNFWMRADLRIRPEFRRGTCFGGGAPVAGACNGITGASGVANKANARTSTAGGDNDFYVQQWARLGIGYDLSPDVGFYMEIIDSAVWGANGNPGNAGNGGDPLNHNCGANNGTAVTTQANCRLGVRAAYALVRNLGGVQGLSMKVGRQYVVFGNHSLFGHFDWANTGYSHDGIMFNYNTKNWETWMGWFRNSETDIVQGAPVGSLAGNTAGTAGSNRPDALGDADMFIFYNQIKSIPGFVVEPYYVLYSNNMHEGVNAAQGLGTAKHSSQLRHMIGNRTEMRKGNWDFVNETAWQFGQMADGVGTDNNRNLTINAWATRNWLGYTVYNHKWKPRLAVGFDYASGDGNANCSVNATAQAGYGCKTANTFENFFPTNYLHAGYMLNHAWKNQVQPQINFQAKPTTQDHLEFWGQMHYLANARDNWYRGAQGVYVFSNNTNKRNYLGSEMDFAWTHMMMNGKVSLTGTYGHFFAGNYITENLGTSADQDWGILQLWVNF